MFWENILYLCAKNNISPNALCSAIGLSNAIATKWKKGSIPHGTTLNRIANYFGVTTEYLLNQTNVREEETKKSSADNGEGNIITHKIAAMGGMDEGNIRTLNKEQMNKWAELIEATRDLPPEKIDMLIKMAESIK